MSSQLEQQPSAEQSLFRVQINQIDHVMLKSGPLDNTNLPKVPVIRVFGMSSSGVKTCMYIHQVYRYFFIKYKGPMDSRSVNQYISEVSRDLTKYLRLSVQREGNTKKGTTNNTERYIRAILLVKGIDFYGFHCSYEPFLKILLINPSHIARAVRLFQEGKIRGEKFYVYESHINFELQFLCDYNLYGCGWLDVVPTSVFQRGQTGTEYDEDEIQIQLTKEEQTIKDLQFKSSEYFAATRMPLEVDIAAHQIMNRHRLPMREIHQELSTEAAPPPEEPFIRSVRELWEDERERRISKGLPPSPAMPVDPSERSRKPGGDWVAEAHWWELLRSRIEQGRTDTPFEVVHQPWEKRAMTYYESIEALWEKEYRHWQPEDSDGDIPVIFTNTEDTRTNRTHSEERGPSILDGDDALSRDVKSVDHDVYGRTDDESSDADSAGAEEDEIPAPAVEATQKESQEPPIVDDVFGTSTKGLLKELNSFQENLLKSSSQQDIAHEPASSNPQEIEMSSLEFPISSDSAAKQTIRDHSQEVDGKRNVRQCQVTVPTGHNNPSSSSFPSSSPLRVHISSDPHNLPAKKTSKYVYAQEPPSAFRLLNTLEQLKQPQKIYQEPYYSIFEDAPDFTREYGGLHFDLTGGTGPAALKSWDGPSVFTSRGPKAVPLVADYASGWEYASLPPSKTEARRWLKMTRRNDFQKRRLKKASQIVGPTQKHPFGLSDLADARNSKTLRERRGMDIFSIEIFVPSKTSMKPDPTEDSIFAISYAFQGVSADGRLQLPQIGILVFGDDRFKTESFRTLKAEVFDTEIDLINRIIDIVRDFDPDILIGWEMQNGCWGFIQRRCHEVYGMNISELISRAPLSGVGAGNEQWSIRKYSTFRAAGRHVLNLWRIMRSELTLTSTSFEATVFHLLGQRVPSYGQDTFNAWHQSDVPAHLLRLLNYIRDRTLLNLEIIDKTETVTRISEFARIFGVDFFSVISRGSQFKVESFMFRISKPENFILISPSKDEVGQQNAAECMPLIMEPKSAFYNSPLLVLDFQSLYPSVMIAYNYCYSTCVGRVTEFKGQYRFGITHLETSCDLLDKLSSHLNIAPNGMMYVKQNVRHGLLGRMLSELLDTRVMVKTAMKGSKGDKALTRILDARQLGLKYIANVTYGYTSASFSGRMPGVEIADSIVQTGREILEKSIALINTTAKWGAKVVYGDTDSVFVYLPGKTKDQAFRIGHDIADTITSLNPAPIKLKFEKVYHPCVLIAKKRYVGFKYENPDDTEPVFDAKGIETVRRDGVPAGQKMEEKCLKILFRTQDLSEVKDYCTSTWLKMLENRASPQDYVFAKEVKLGTYNDEVAPQPGVAVAARKVLIDPNDETQYGERVPYVIIRGDPGTNLIDRTISPLEFLENPHTHLDHHYYITHMLIPPLSRIFNLVGADVAQWFDSMPKSYRVDEIVDLNNTPTPGLTPSSRGRFKIDVHFKSNTCTICAEVADEPICEDCRLNPQMVISELLSRIRKGERRLRNVQQICASCIGCETSEPIECISVDCAWLFERVKAERKCATLIFYQDLIKAIGHEDDTL